MTLLFEGGILSPSFKEVAKGTIQMSESLLEKNRRNLVQPKRLFLLLEQYQALGSTFIVQALATLVVGICTLLQCPIVDVATTAEGLCQYAFLFITWIEAILVGFLLFHALHAYLLYCKLSRDGSFSSRPVPEGGSFRSRYNREE
jgi:hypothetical protein